MMNDPRTATPADLMRLGLDAAIRLCHQAAVNAGWWTNSQGQRLRRNKGEMIAFMHKELSECLEAESKGLMDEHLPDRRAAEVKLATLFIRICDYAGAHGYDIPGAVGAKLAYNAVKWETREKK